MHTVKLNERKRELNNKGSKACNAHEVNQAGPQPKCQCLYDPRGSGGTPTQALHLHLTWYVGL